MFVLKTEAAVESCPVTKYVLCEVRAEREGTLSIEHGCHGYRV